MIVTTFKEPIWPCIKTTLEYLAEKRREPVPGLVKAGLNFSIVLGSACFLEGILESVLRAILFNSRKWDIHGFEIDGIETRRAIYSYYNRLEEDLAQRVGRSVGAAAYDEMFELLVGHRLSQLKDVSPLWEGITVPFNFRNVLGHGREVSARHFAGGAVQDGFKEDFSGSYRVVEEYLRRQRLLQHRFVDGHSEYLYLSDQIADHFWVLAKAVPAAIISSLPEKEQNACRKSLEDALAQ